MTLIEEKQALRREVRAAERTLDAAYRAASDEAIVSHVLTLPLYREAATVFCFVSIPGEVNTWPLLAHALATGKTLCVPRCGPAGRMELCRLNALEELRPGAYGIMEPPPDSLWLTADEVDFALIPCLSCDRQGRRLGKGGGYYDRFLAVYAGGRAVVCREALLRPCVPVEAHDVPISWVITEKGVFPGIGVCDCLA